MCVCVCVHACACACVCVCVCVHVCGVHFYCLAQLSMFSMEKRNRNKIIIIIINNIYNIHSTTVKPYKHKSCTPVLLRKNLFLWKGPNQNSLPQNNLVHFCSHLLFSQERSRLFSSDFQNMIHTFVETHLKVV